MCRIVTRFLSLLQHRLINFRISNGWPITESYEILPGIITNGYRKRSGRERNGNGGGGGSGEGGGEGGGELAVRLMAIVQLDDVKKR